METEMKFANSRNVLHIT